MKTEQEIRNAFRLRVDDDILVRLAEECDKDIYREMLHSVGHREEKLEFETDWKTKDSIRHIIEKTGGFDFAIFFKSKLVGTIRFKMIERRWRERSSNIGYELDPKFRGLGLVTKSLRECIELVYQNLDLDRLEVDGDVKNLKSEAVVKRLGFHFEGIKRHERWENGVPVDFWLYSMIREDWTAARETKGSNHSCEATTA